MKQARVEEGVPAGGEFKAVTHGEANVKPLTVGMREHMVPHTDRIIREARTAVFRAQEELARYSLLRIALAAQERFPAAERIRLTASDGDYMELTGVYDAEGTPLAEAYSIEQTDPALTTPFGDWASEETADGFRIGSLAGNLPAQESEWFEYAEVDESDDGGCSFLVDIHEVAAAG